MNTTPTTPWNTSLYDDKHSFVWKQRPLLIFWYQSRACASSTSAAARVI